MPKKDSKKKDTKDSKGVEADAVAAVRSAVERTLHASAEGAHVTRERTREIVDEIAQAAGRIRHTLEDLHVLDEIKRLRGEVETLAARIGTLERLRGGAKPAEATGSSSEGATDAKSTARKKAKAKAKSAAKRAAAKKPAANKRATSKRAAGKREASEPGASEPAVGEPPAGEPALSEPAAGEPPASTASTDATKSS